MFALSPYPPAVFIAVAAFCVLLVGLSKGGLGGGVSALATPLMSLVVSPLAAAGFLLPLLCACDLLSMWHYRRDFDRRGLRALLSGGFAGIALGTAFLCFFKDDRAAADRPLKLAVGLLALAFVVFQAVRRRLQAQAKTAAGVPPATDSFGRWMGGLAGFGSMLAHAGGPPVAIYLIERKLDRRIFAGTAAWFFTLANYTKLVPYFWLGMIDMKSLPASLWFFPLAPVGVWLGVAFNRRVPQALFEKIVDATLALTAIQLIGGLNVFDLFGK